MHRWIVVLVAALPLAACDGGQDFWSPATDTAWLFGDPAATPAQQRYDNEHCKKVAYARAADANANGFDGDIRDQVYAGTYATCAAWDHAHPLPPGSSPVEAKKDTPPASAARQPIAPTGSAISVN